MADFEQKALENYHLKRLIWKRFIDDIFLIWTHGENELRKFVEYLNSLHNTIKFTCEQTISEIAFLDTLVKIDPESNQVYTSPYTKPIDTHSYLHYRSAHQKSCVKKAHLANS